MASKPKKNRPKPRFIREKKKHKFMKSLREIVVDMTAIEVHTIVVPRLSEHKFIAGEVYRDIYNISPQSLEQQGVHKSLSDRYLDLRRKLEREYTLLLTEPNSEFYDPTIKVEPNSPTVEIDELNTRLPPPLLKHSEPETTLKTKKLLRNHHFLRSLRKISEIKEALDNCNTELLIQSQEGGGGGGGGGRIQKSKYRFYLCSHNHES